MAGSRKENGRWRKRMSKWLCGGGGSSSKGAVQLLKKLELKG